MILVGDSRQVLETLEDNSVDSIVTDPPYELGFMNKDWDSRGIAYDSVIWSHCLRVLKPGGHLIAFGGSRTYHRLAVAIEDVGFEIRDQIQWIYGSGFPKSLDVSKALDKLAGADGEWIVHPTYSKRNGNGADSLFGQTNNRSETRYLYSPETELAKQWAGWGTGLKPAHEPMVLARKPLIGTVSANIVKWGVGAINIDGCRVNAKGEIYERKGTRPRTRGYVGIKSDEEVPTNPQSSLGRWASNAIFDEESARLLDSQSNSASRFFYVAKASRGERDEGLETLTQNYHPTVKPIELMRYLVRLVTPKGGTVLDPFLGSGSTGCAAVLENFQFVGIELDPEYAEIARLRINYWENSENNP